jgi:predicted RNA binding protein YcfA (HicA-like mRNA interferase family)
MSKLGPVGRRELVRRLRALGFDGPFQEGRHPFVVRGSLRLPIPNQHGEDISTGLLARILKDGGISREEWDSTK